MKLVEQIEQELDSGKTPHEIKKELKKTHSSREVSKALHLVLKEKLEKRVEKVENPVEEKINVVDVWMLAAIGSILAIVILAAIWIYFFS